MVVQQSTTSRNIVFLMVDSSDHVTGKTGLTVTVTLSKNGAAFGAAAGAVTEISSGWYKLAGNATDDNTLGALALHATSAGADPTDMMINVVAYNPDDAVRLGLTALPNAAAEAAGGLYTRGTGAGQINQANNGQIDVNTVRLGGTTQTARDIGASVLLSGNEDAIINSFSVDYGTIIGVPSSTTAPLRAGAPSYDLTNQYIYLLSGTGAKPSAGTLITAYNTSTKVVTVASWPNGTPSTDTVYLIRTQGALLPNEHYNVAQSVWTTNSLSGYAAGSAAKTLSAAGSAGDPWSTALPGAYGSGTAGFIVGTYLTGNAYTRLGAPVAASISADIAAIPAASATSVWAAGARTLTAQSDSSGVTTLLTRVPGVVQPQTGDAYARLGAPAGASMSADIAAIPGAVWGVGARTLTAQSDSAGVTSLLTRIPNAAPNAAGGLLTYGTGTGQINPSAGEVPTAYLFSGSTSAGSISTIKLDGAVATNSYYVGMPVTIKSNTGAGQTRIITGYVGATQVATVSPNWVTAPTNGSGYIVGLQALPAIDSSGNVTVGGYATGMSPKEQVVNLAVPGESGLTLGQAIYNAFLGQAGKFGLPVRSGSAPWTITVPFIRASDGATVFSYVTTYTDNTFARTTSRTYTTSNLPSF